MAKLLKRQISYDVSRALLTAISAFVTKARWTLARAKLVEDLVPIVRAPWQDVDIFYRCPGRWPFKRSVEAKPDMAAWIGSFEPDAVFWDIGANIGVYTLYAAAKGTRTVAIEPEAASHALLHTNIDRNGLGETVIALNIGIGDRTGLAKFELADTAIGTPRHQVRADSAASASMPVRNILVVAGRDLPELFGVPRPTHINVDVDGSELAVVRGLPLDGPGLRSIRCELRQNGDAAEIVALLEAAGLHAERPLERVSALKRGVVNIVFERQDAAQAAA